MLEWKDEMDPAFLHQLEADADVLDYCVYSLPDPTNGVKSELNITSVI